MTRKLALSLGLCLWIVLIPLACNPSPQPVAPTLGPSPTVQNTTQPSPQVKSTASPIAPTTEATAIIRTPTPEETARQENLEVYFFDVGQGDSILVDFGHTEILIDGGGRSPGVVPYLRNHVEGRLEAMVATHPHADHIGGLINVLAAFEVEEIWHNGDTSTSKTYSDFMVAVKAEKAKVNIATRGNVIDVNGLSFKVLNPADLKGTTNNNSIVLHLAYGGIDFLFEGDAEKEAEGAMLVKSDFPVPDVEILKVGHHGSRTSSSGQFLELAKPEVAIYSAKKGNSYGHPHVETMNALNNIGVKIYGTDANGTIIVTTDGTVYEVKAANQVVPTPPSQPIKTPGVVASVSGVQIQSVNLNSEVVTILNSGGDPVDMTGWRLVSITGNQQYTFPAFILQAGATVQVASGPVAVDNPPTQLKWTSGYIWNNDGDPAALYDGSNSLISSYP
ncbi:lamin tail domain-containing protein [Chloroflexota bacterium]